jgi:hypothetical protein
MTNYGKEWQITQALHQNDAIALPEGVYMV